MPGTYWITNGVMATNNNMRPVTGKDIITSSRLEEYRAGYVSCEKNPTWRGSAKRARNTHHRFGAVLKERSENGKKKLSNCNF